MENREFWKEYVVAKTTVGNLLGKEIKVNEKAQGLWLETIGCTEAVWVPIKKVFEKCHTCESEIKFEERS